MDSINNEIKAMIQEKKRVLRLRCTQRDSLTAEIDRLKIEIENLGKSPIILNEIDAKIRK